MKKSGRVSFFIVAILIFALTYAAFFGIKNYFGDKEMVYVKSASDIRWGIDIQGGVEAVFTPEVGSGDVTETQMNSAETVIKNRLVNRNITDYEVYADVGNRQVIVRFPWQSGETEFDAAQAINELGATALLTFCEGTDNSTVLLSGATDVESAQAGFDENSNPIVQLRLTSDGRSKFAEATARLQGQTISIWLDDSMISAPTVQSVITDGNASITNMGSIEAAQELANSINAGALPFRLSVDDSKLQIISPTLGKEALNIMLIAGVIAFSLVCLVMLVYYRLPGLVACIALVGQVGGMIACVSGFFPAFNSFTLTIPGIAGIILSIGMGVDANVITTERVIEELRKGKTIDGAIDAGSENSFSAILDGNVTVILVSIVLMGAFGPPDNFMAKLLSPLMFMFSASITGSIYSFGYTLLMGVIFNFIMGVLASRIMLKGVSRFKFLRRPWLYGGVKNA